MDIWRDVKEQFGRPDNAVTQLILINVGVFVVMGIILVITTFIDGKLFQTLLDWLALPARADVFITRPWTLITYSFLHSFNLLLHILFNMLFLFWFGRLVQEYLGSQKVVNLYILGAIAGGLLFLLTHNLIPFYIESVAQDELKYGILSRMIGASAAVYAVMVAAATLLPDYRFHLIFIGPVKIKYLVGVLIFLSFLGTVGSNAGGDIAHLGGAIIGYFYIKQLQKGTDWGKWIGSMGTYIKSFFKPQPRIKVSKGGRERKRTAKSEDKRNPSQQEIDRILDKISERGYESLSKEEKEKLFNAGK